MTPCRIRDDPEAALLGTEACETYLAGREASGNGREMPLRTGLKGSL
jgi:hypothetical protein